MPGPGSLHRIDPSESYSKVFFHELKELEQTDKSVNRFPTEYKVGRGSVWVGAMWDIKHSFLSSLPRRNFLVINVSDHAPEWIRNLIEEYGGE